jgi:dTDP-glucose 4,6-dehydratase
MDIAKIRRELSWQPQESFDSGLRKTVSWYLSNRWWWEPIWTQRYRGERLGVGGDRGLEEAPPPAPAAE